MCACGICLNEGMRAAWGWLQLARRCRRLSPPPAATPLGHDAFPGVRLLTPMLLPQDVHTATVIEVLQSIRQAEMSPILSRIYESEGGPEVLDTLMKYLYVLLRARVGRATIAALLSFCFDWPGSLIPDVPFPLWSPGRLNT